MAVHPPHPDQNEDRHPRIKLILRIVRPSLLPSRPRLVVGTVTEIRGEIYLETCPRINKVEAGMEVGVEVVGQEAAVDTLINKVHHPRDMAGTVVEIKADGEVLPLNSRAGPDSGVR